MSDDLDRRILKTGMSLYRLLEGESPSVFKRDYWIGKMLDLCMQDEVFKVQMLRFVDVFPYLRRPESVANHFKEYFSGPDVHYPALFQWGIKHLPSGSLSSILIAKGLTSNILNIGRQFIAGASPREALGVLENLRSQGTAFTVDLLGEAVVSEVEAEEYHARYLNLLNFMHAAGKNWKALGQAESEYDWGHSPMVNVSLKTTAMYSQMSPCAFEHSISKAKERLRPIFRKAMETGAFVSLDMEQYSLKDLTLALYRSLMEEDELRDYPHTGLVVQAYLRESESDLSRLLEWAKNRGTRFTIRLVKGAYWDSEVVWARQNNWPIPVFTNKAETDANFEKLSGMLLRNHDLINFACASHNIRSIASVIEQARDIGVPEGRFEFQVLYGMGEPVRNALGKAGLPLRIYTPVGEMIQGMSYLVRRLLENTANESFLRKSFAQGESKAMLLANPLDAVGSVASKTIKDGPIPTGNTPLGRFENEPVLDWSRAEHRDRFAAALSQIRKSFPIKIPLIIGGKKVTSKAELSSTNPNKPGEVVGRVSAAGLAEAERAIHAAESAFPEWRSKAPEARAEYLFKAAAAARKMRYDLVALQVLEVGKSWSEADADVCEAIDYLEYYGREMVRLATPRRMGRVPGEVSELFYEPRGVSVVIAPWNFPLAISMGMTSAAVVAGNTVIYKPSSLSPAVGLMVHKVFEEARLPPGVLNFLPGPGKEIGDYLVTHPSVALIAFTGSKAVGLRILELASKQSEKSNCVKNVIVEMGGKNAIIVDADADLDEAIVHVLRSAFSYQGQKCSACSRLIVLEENYERVVSRLKSAAESLHLGPPEDPKNFMGALIEPAAREKVLEYIRIGKEEGNLLLERKSAEATGYFAPLAIFTDIRPEHRLAREEIFGPVLAVMKVGNFDEAIEVANSTEYALTGGLFSRSPRNILRAGRELRVGNLYVNRGCTGAIVGRHPFGGFKMSGVGSKAGGPDYLLQFMVPRNVVENTLRRGFAPAEQDDAVRVP
jgi:RHH-type proline utilization regulon transcriptional repressor/proline dehydrogenase/delta 1-pyrroline-5-carboxylate dehydrogenase